MSATLTVNRETARAAVWYLFEGAMFAVFLANTTGAATPPALNGDFANWTPYFLASQFDLFLTAGSGSYDATNAQQAKLQQLSIVVGYNQSVTYTDLIIYAVPVQAPTYVENVTPDFAYPFVAVIHESTAVTLTSSQTKTYKLDFTAEWL